RRPVQPAFRRHQPGQGRPRVRAGDPGRRALAGLRLGRVAPRLGLLRGVLPGRREADPPGRRVRLRPDPGADPRVPRHADRAGPRRDSPYRTRSGEETLDLFRRMRAGECPDASRTLRAKIDMASGNITLRDPALYRIKKVAHQTTGDAWPIYPMYDYAHSLGDAVEGITHSLCTLEFEHHRQ